MDPPRFAVPSPAFEIRRNPDGSFDAICMRCYLTAGTTFDMSDLAEVEAAHHCDPSLLIDVAYHCWTS
jgi:hypothetical protein